jgi:hypothetical protein
VLRALNLKLLTKLKLKTSLLDTDELKALFSKSPQLSRFDTSNGDEEKPDLFFKNLLDAIITAPNFHAATVKELNLHGTTINELY